MSKNALTKLLGVIALAVALVSGVTAGPEQYPDRSKDKEVQVVQPQPVCDPRWYLSIGGGADFSLGQKINHGFDKFFNVETDMFGFRPARAEIKSHDWDDVYDDAWRIQGEAGYALTQHLEVFGLFKYAHADANDHTTGSRVVVFPFFSTFGSFAVPLTSEFEDYSAWGGELGFRFFFLSREARFRPYVAFSAGATHVDSIGIETRGDFSGTFGGASDELVYKGGFFDDSWVATGAAMFGVEARVACHWSIGVEGGARYESRLSQNDGDFHGDTVIGNPSFAIAPLQAFRDANNDAGDRWIIPVTGYVKFRF